jgi:hypothetical protein
VVRCDDYGDPEKTFGGYSMRTVSRVLDAEASANSIQVFLDSLLATHTVMLVGMP